MRRPSLSRPVPHVLVALALAALVGCGSGSTSGSDSGSGDGSDAADSAGSESADGADPDTDGEDAAGADPSEKNSSEEAAADTAFGELEQEFDARLGVYALDTGSGAEVAHRADERFAVASTFKALAAGAVLDQYGLDGLNTLTAFDLDDLVSHSPVTERFAGDGMPLGDLAAAAVRQSDNTAANLLLEALGGPSGFTEALRAVGDDVTRIDRWETELNDVPPGEERDTSTPRALSETLSTYLLGDILDAQEKDRLAEWMTTNTTSATLIPAGVPDSWIVADKSGGASYGIRNDIAVLWPEEGEPVLLSVLSNRDEEADESDDALIARAATAALEALGR
ncbi:class A beta-lactamase [Streptomyces otsuchiensis]|uniref:class A beta-lactamase n=1 Tax=Streptomyces otsuchiensis TaxID=2681388 RepID=UPI0010317947|nr:class A beta-lactamase [Streptomyces otsuchiensis]